MLWVLFPVHLDMQSIGYTVFNQHLEEREIMNCVQNGTWSYCILPLAIWLPCLEVQLPKTTPLSKMRKTFQPGGIWYFMSTTEENEFTWLDTFCMQQEFARKIKSITDGQSIFSFWKPRMGKGPLGLIYSNK